MLLPKAVYLYANSMLMKLVECNIIIEHVLDCEMFYESGYKMNERHDMLLMPLLVLTALWS